MRSTIGRFRALCSAREGVAAVEFALILPFMLLLYFGSIEASSLFTMNRRIVTVSGTIGDLVARANGAITEAEIEDYFKAARSIMVPYATTGLQQVVSLVQVNADGTTRVVWSRASGGSPRLEDAAYPLPASEQMNQTARGGYLIAAEVSLSYRPALGIVFEDAISLYSESFFLPRFGEPISEPTA